MWTRNLIRKHHGAKNIARNMSGPRILRNQILRNQNRRMVATLNLRGKRETNSFNFGNSRWIHASSVLQSTVPFKLADIGEGIAEAEVLQWFVEPGDTVAQFDKICEVQSDKASVEITSRYDGKISKLCWEVGDMAKVGSTLVEIEVEGANQSASGEEKVGESASSGVTKEQELEQEPEQLVEIARPPPTLERAGSFTVDPILRPSNEELGSATSIPRILPSDDTEKVLAAPAVRRLAKDHGLDLVQIPASGPGGRVLKGDVLHYIATVPLEERKKQAERLRRQERVEATAQESTAPSAPTAVPGGQTPNTNDATSSASTVPANPVLLEKLEQDKVIPVRGIQRIMVKSMTESLKIPHFNFMEEYSVTELSKFRNELKPIAQAQNLSLSYMPILIKAVSLSLVQYPGLNAHINSDATEVVHKASHNIGVAMDTPIGLLVPVVKNCQDKSIFEIAGDLLRLQALGAENKLGEEDLTGGTFTLSNIGAIGGTYASPVIPAPTVLIGAIGKIQTVPKFVDPSDLQSVYAAQIMNISWAADHRVVDGATVARFSKQLASYLENPLAMISSMK